MNYYRGYPELFEPFYSVENKIKPRLADDWKIISGGYEKGSSFILYSEKTNQLIHDIKLIKFLEFSELVDLEVKGLKIKGKFIVGNNRSLYTEEMYNKWKKEYKDNSLISNIVNFIDNLI